MVRRLPMRSALNVLVLVAGVSGLCGCDISAECLPWHRGLKCFDTDLGQTCSSNEATLKRVTVKPGSNDVVADPGFENCQDFYCASTNGSVPYCTRRCESNFDCNPGGLPCFDQVPDSIPCRDRANWNCEVVIEFGALACTTVDPNTGTCELDPVTGKVKNPVKYCRAKEGFLPQGDYTDVTAASPDGGTP